MQIRSVCRRGGWIAFLLTLALSTRPDGDDPKVAPHLICRNDQVLVTTSSEV